MNATACIIGIMIPLAALLSGCRTPACNKVVLSDPLLVSRKPVEADPVTSPPVLYASTEPTMPAHPFGATYAVNPPRFPSGSLTSTPDEATPPSREQ